VSFFGVNIMVVLLMSMSLRSIWSGCLVY
jgi:nitrogen fixation protein FixH